MGFFTNPSKIPSLIKLARAMPSDFIEVRKEVVERIPVDQLDTKIADLQAQLDVLQAQKNSAVIIKNIEEA